MSPSLVQSPKMAVETRPRVVFDDPVPDNSSLIWRFRLSAVCGVLSALAFIQDPGRIAADTKLDLAINPLGLMARGLHLWDPQSFSGSLQNQAYGYLWPIGPYYWLTHAVGMPAWVAQRLWWSLLLSVAFLGMVKLVRVMDVGGRMPAVVAGLAYALSPMMLSKLGPISSEALPIALAPWVLIPLVLGSQSGSPRRWAALSAVAVLCVGGVNAVAAISVLPLGAWWLLTRANGRRKWSLLGWWTLGVGLATLWWLIPLIILGKYSPPFLDWIESASVTTSVTNPTNVLRGTSDWLGFFADGSGPVWDTGWIFATNPLVIAATGVLSIVGVAGLADRSLPHRRFLIGGVVAGLILVTVGHIAPVDGLGANGLHRLLDGVLSPLRNVHKFDPVLRVPLILAMAWVLQRAAARRPTTPKWPYLPAGWWRKSVVLACCLSVGVCGLAVALGGETRDRSFVEIPPYWRHASDWLAQHGENSKALIAPGAAFAQFMWGRTQDEPLQALGSVAWDVRDAVPLGNAGHTRLLDAIQQQFDNGKGSAALTEVLSRSGFRWIVVRNDVDPQAIGETRLSLVHQSLERSVGISRVASFGPKVRPTARLGSGFEYGINRSYPAVEIFRVGPATAASPATLRSAADPLIVTGAAEAMLALAQASLLGPRSVIVAADAAAAGLPVGTTIATDTARRREINFGYSRDNATNTMTADEPWQLDRLVHDYALSEAFPSTFAQLDGATSLTASTSGSDANSRTNPDPSQAPFSALDGDAGTAWRSGAWTGADNQWWQVTFPKPVSMRGLSASFVNDRLSSRPTRVTVATDVGTQEIDVVPTSAPQPLNVGAGLTTKLRVGLARRDPRGPNVAFGISEITIPSVAVTRPVRVRSTTPVDGAVFSAVGGQRDGCVRGPVTYRCAVDLARPGAEQAGIDRWVWLKAGHYAFGLTTSPRVGGALDRWLAPSGGAITATASSQINSHPATRAQAATDGDPQTIWLAAPADRQPEVTLHLPAVRTVASVTLVTPAKAATALPVSVELTAGGRRFVGFPDRTGRMSISPVATETVKIKVLSKYVPRSAALHDSFGDLPVGFAEVVLGGADDLRKGIAGSSHMPIACGVGPTITIDGKTVPTRGSAEVAELIAGDTSQLDSCGSAGGFALKQGWHRVTAKASAQLNVDELTVLPARGLDHDSAAPRSGAVLLWEDAHRTVDLGSRPASQPQTLETTENFNAGWQATASGQQLKPVQVDGWRQAWVVPAGVFGLVTMNFEPDSAYRWGLIVGLIAAVSLLFLLGIRSRKPAPPGVADSSNRWAVPAIVMLGCLLIAGVVGVAVGIAAALFGIVAQRRYGAAAAPVLAGGCVAAAIVLELIWRWPASLSQPVWVSVSEAVLVTASLGFVASAGAQLTTVRRERRAASR